MSFKRKFERQHGIRRGNPKCCGEKMMFKESYGCYVCQCCGKEKHIENMDNNKYKEVDEIEKEIEGGN